MTYAWINCYIVAEKELAYGVAPCAANTFEVASNKFLWVPKSKVALVRESDLKSKEIQMHNESVVRVGIPSSLGIDNEFLAKVKADQYAFS